MRNSGHGWAVDLGVSYQTEFATWGASILDIGSMTFSQQTAENRWVINKPSQINTDQLSLSNGTTSLSNQLDSQLSVDSSITRQRFSMQAPTSLRLSYDYYLSHDTYVSAELRQPIPIDRNALRTAPTVAVSWRKENRWWSITGSAVLTDYRELSLGIGARLGVVTIGTDDLLSIATKGNLSKGSIYAAVKINPFGTGGGGKVRCPRVKRSPFDSAQTVRGARRMGVYGRQM